MRNAIAAIAIIISILSGIPYIIDTARGKTHPNLVTWVTWTMLNALNTLAAFSDGSYHTALLSGSSTLCTGVIVALGVKYGVKKYTAFDAACQIFAIVGLIAWKLTNEPALAVGIAITVDMVAALPTWRHAWIAPLAETWEGFGLAAIAGVLTLLSLTSFTFVSLAFPIYFALNSVIIVTIILGRRRSMTAGAQSAG